MGRRSSSRDTYSGKISVQIKLRSASCSNLMISKRFDRLFHFTNDCVLITDSEGIVTDINQRALDYFGRAIIGSSIYTLFTGLTIDREDLKNTQIIHSFHVHCLKRAGDLYAFKLTLVPVTKGKDVRELFLILKDLRELESYEREIERLKVRLSAVERENESRKRLQERGNQSNKLSAVLEELERANSNLDHMNRELMKELELASMVQKSLVPVSFPEHEDLHFAFHFEPMGLLGGDYYDVVSLKDGKVGLIVADVSGHGVGSAFIAAMLKISFINLAPRCNSPAELLTGLNTEYCQLIQTGEYVTAFYTIIDPRDQKIIYSGAGHPMPFLSHPGSRQGETLKSEGFFLGMFEGAEYKDTVCDFMHGDRFFVYTDGIIEAFSTEENTQYGMQRLFESFDKHKNRSAEVLLSLLIEEVKRFMNKNSFHDDMVLAVVDYGKVKEK
jgi:serine phosphatase RsbU (regulator of sigma subunit)